MNFGFTLALLVTSLSIYAQHAILEPDNPAPRVGEQVNLNILMGYENLSELDNKSDKSESDYQRLAANRVATGTMKLVQVVTDTGAMNIGPLSFRFNGKMFEAPAITVFVRPALPANATDGLWVKVVRYNDYIYVIAEQRKPSQLKRDPNDPNTIVLNSDDHDFAELNTEKVEKQGLVFISSSVNMDNQMMEQKGTAINVSYRLAAYKFKPSPFFDNKLRIDKSFFGNSPKRINIEEPNLK